MRKIGYMALTVGLLVAAGATQASAGWAPAVPEISPGSLSTGLALVAGGVMLARARWRK